MGWCGFSFTSCHLLSISLAFAMTNCNIRLLNTQRVMNTSTKFCISLQHVKYREGSVRATDFYIRNVPSNHDMVCDLCCVSCVVHVARRALAQPFSGALIYGLYHVNINFISSLVIVNSNYYKSFLLIERKYKY